MSPLGYDNTSGANIFPSDDSRTAKPGDIPVWDSGRWIPKSLSAPISSTIPTNPTNGDRFLYPVSSGGYWEFQYDATSKYWAFVGGTPLLGYSGGPISSSLVSSFQQIYLGFSMPFAGDYVSTVQAQINNATTSADLLLGAGTGASLIDGTYAQQRAAGNQSIGLYMTHPNPVTFTAGQNLCMLGWTNNPAPSATNWNWMRLVTTPTRIH